MSKSLMKSLITSLFPKGSVWVPKVAGFFDLLIDGIADSFTTVKTFLGSLADIRNAKRTTVLDELERDYGVPFNPALTEAERRAALHSRINSIDNTGSRQELEKALQNAGFPLFVYNNSPAVDPRLFETDYLMVAGGDNAFAGLPTAIAGAFFSDLVVNGDVIISTPVYRMSAGSQNAFAGYSGAIAGIASLVEKEFIYYLPIDSTAWPFIFFVGGEATFALDGSLVTIESVSIDDDRRLELREIILKYKPEFTWGVLIVNYT